jgi:hypothetical protein
MKDHPVYADPELLNIRTLKDFSNLFEKHNSFHNNSDLEAIIASLDLFRLSPKKPEIDEAELLRFIRIMFDFCDDLTVFSTSLYNFFVSQQEPNSTHLCPITVSNLYQQIITQHPDVFLEYLHALVKFQNLRFHVLNRRLATLNFVHIIETVLTQATPEQGQLFLDKFEELSHLTTLQELNLGLTGWMRAVKLSERPTTDTNDNPPTVTVSENVDLFTPLRQTYTCAGRPILKGSHDNGEKQKHKVTFA